MNKKETYAISLHGHLSNLELEIQGLEGLIYEFRTKNSTRTGDIEKQISDKNHQIQELCASQVSMAEKERSMNSKVQENEQSKIRRWEEFQLLYFH